MPIQGTAAFVAAAYSGVLTAVPGQLVVQARADPPGVQADGDQMSENRMISGHDQQLSVEPKRVTEKCPKNCPETTMSENV